MGKQKKNDSKSSTIVLNKKARHDYFIEDKYEAGMALEGWEVKSLRAGRVQLNESYVFVKEGECFLSGCMITPLETASTHITPEQRRIRKLLLHKKEINKLTGLVERKGYTLIATAMYWSKGNIKLEIAVGQGKKAHDKRATEKDRDWQRQKQRIMKKG